MTLSFLLKRFVDGAETPGLARHCAWVSSIPPALLKRLGIDVAVAVSPAPRDGLLLDRIQRWDLETSLAEGLLTKADRGSMSSALELRAPFLDQSVMHFAASLPAMDRVRGFSTKIFLKQYALRYLPREIVHRRKRGLSVPLARWLRGPLREWAERALANPRLETAGLKPMAATELLNEHLLRQADHARAIWTLIALSEWLDWVFEETATAANANRGRQTIPVQNP
jgi:asparagine synthase (glutamine-hydrolysing)